MPHVKFDSDADNVVSGSYSTGTGPVLRSENMEVTKISFAKGKGADTHQHAGGAGHVRARGRLEVTCDGETYGRAPGRGDLQPLQRAAQRDGDRGRRRAQLQEPGRADLRAPPAGSAEAAAGAWSSRPAPRAPRGPQHSTAAHAPTRPRTSGARR